ncbi:MAG TPA: flagellar basal body-associated FliL family protein [Rhodocyclaceae bacterium]|nr:flagellar basal body-associated FliL family protein [Rhodocyclaceae bacterium]
MAEAKTGEEAPKKKGKLLLFIIIGVVVLAIGAVAAVLLLKKAPAEEEDGDAPAHKTEVKKEKAGGHQPPPVYVKLDTFTTNLAFENPGEQSAAQYVQLVAELKVETAPEGEELKQYMPEIRNVVLRLLSAKKPSQLTSVEGKDALAEEIRNSVNNIVNPPKRKNAQPPEGPVTAVLFSSFIIQ